MKRSGFSRVGLMSVILILFSAMELFAIPSTISFQGVLRNSGGTPVTDGNHDATFSLFTVPTGGSSLWSETQVINTSGGLFTCELGKTVSLSSLFPDNSENALYLQITVFINGAPVTMSPRTPILSTPYSSTTSSVQGDLKTKPGEVIIRSPGSTTGTIRMHASTDSGSTIILDADVDGDGFADGELSQVVTADSVIKEITINSPAPALLMKAKEKANRTKCQNNMRCTNPGTGASTESDISCDATSAKHAINTKGAGANDRHSITSSTTTEASEILLEADVTGDDIDDRSITSTCDATSAKHAINTKGTGANNGHAMSVSSRTDESSASVVCAADLDGDGIMENAVTTTCDADSARTVMIGAKSASITATATPGGGGARSATLNVSATPGGSAGFKAINTTGTGATVRCAASADSAASTILLEADVDGDGFVDGELSQVVTGDSVIKEITINSPAPGLLMKAKEKANRTKCQNNMRCTNPGTGASTESDITCDATSAKHAINTKGAGANDRSITSTTTAEACSILLEADLDGDGLAENEITQNCDSANAQLTVKVKNGGTVKGNINVMQANRVMATMLSDGRIYADSGLGVGTTATHKIDVVGGAYCDGTNWTNASDANAKENFEQIDGSELLDKISALPITRWNYKGHTSVEHIGPTAQDFKKLFGVGENDKSISTIDPSGIALAAIKELTKRNQQLEKQNEQQQKQLQDLQNAVAKLMKQVEKSH